ncbi:MAG: hypothetical protein LRS49_04470, partial [Desulfurococcales archaeon]|nr:hypothetical protein [Desulfurococcales archaeon]
MALYALREPPGTLRGDLALLLAAAINRRRLLGVYWIPSRRRLAAVFRDPVDRWGAFEPLPEEELARAYRMECPRGCGLCCAARSGAIALDVELRYMPGWARGL